MRKLFFLVSLVIIEMTANQVNAKTYTKSICNGDSVQIGAESPTGDFYIWNTNPIKIEKIIYVHPTNDNKYVLSIWDQNQMPLGKDTFEVKVLPSPNAFISVNPGQIICLGESVVLTATGGNNYVWNTGQTNPITVSPNVTTTYTVTVTDTNGCKSVSKTVIIVNPLPKSEITINSLTTGNVVQKICKGESVILTATGGTSYCWGIGLINDNPVIASPNNTTTYTVTVTDANGCTANASATLTVNPLPIITLTGKLGSVCNNTNPFIPNITTPSGGNWSGQGISNGTIYPGSLNPGKYIETYSYTDANGCSTSKTDTITINPTPIINFTKVDPMCEESDAVQLLATPISGTFVTTAKLINGFIFDPTINKAGTYQVSYIASNSFGCTDTSTQQIVVNPLPNVTLTLNPNHICDDVNEINLNGGNPAGGIYSGTAVSNGKLYPSLSGIGTFEITYTVTDQNSCTNKARDLLTVNPIPNVIFNQIVGPIYLNTPAFQLTQGIPAGGSYSGDGVVADWFNPASAGLGQHTLTYTYTHPNTGCIGTQIQWITVLGINNGIKEFQFSNLEIFPNPVKDILNITGMKNISKIEIFNSIGQKVFEKNNPKSEIQILFGNYDKGLYIIRFNNLYSKKIVKE